MSRVVDRAWGKMPALNVLAYHTGSRGLDPGGTRQGPRPRPRHAHRAAAHYERRPHTASFSTAAITELKRLPRVGPEEVRHEAEERFSKAKPAFTKAAIAALQGMPLAEMQTRRALEELEAARHALSEIHARGSATSTWRSVPRCEHRAGAPRSSSSCIPRSSHLSTGAGLASGPKSTPVKAATYAGLGFPDRSGYSESVPRCPGVGPSAALPSLQQDAHLALNPIAGGSIKTDRLASPRAVFSEMCSLLIQGRCLLDEIGTCVDPERAAYCAKYDAAQSLWSDLCAQTFGCLHSASEGGLGMSSVIG